jgi:Putative collagen-binding domain of a collagenase
MVDSLCFPEFRVPLLGSPADWISPGGDIYYHNPPATDGRKVVLLDIDHFFWTFFNDSQGGANWRRWVWKSFARGHNPISMEDLPSNINPPDADADLLDGDDPRWEPLRHAMGHTGNFASTINLVAMTPRGDLTSTTYALANPGQEYLVYVPSGGNFTVNLSGSSQNFRVEWFNPATGISSDGESVAGGANRSFSAPFSADAVLYLKAAGI